MSSSTPSAPLNAAWQPPDFFHTTVTGDARTRVDAVLASTMISEGKMTAEFERRLASDFGFSRPVAVNSGTTALELALRLANVKAGDEVILPANTFIATGLAILHVGATPVFADIELDTGNLDAQAVRKAVTPRTKAVIPVHWGGAPCDLESLKIISGECGAAVIEDAAHAFGAIYQGTPIGAVSRFTAFSFQAIKHLSTGDGGAVCCIDPGDEERARRIRWFGIDRKNSAMGFLGEREYDADEAGFKWHMNDVAAALGIGNMTGLRERLERRREIHARLDASLSGVSGIRLLRNREGDVSACWIYTMLVERRDDFVRAMQSRQVPVSVVHRRIDRNSVFGGLRDLPVQEEFDSQKICLPSHEAVTDGQLEEILARIGQGW